MAWQNRILRVNLTDGSCSAEPLNRDWAQAYLGQRGLGSGTDRAQGAVL